MDKKIISISLVTLVVAGSLGFYGGMRYAQSKGLANGSQNAFQQMRGSQNGTATGTRRFGNGQAGGFLSGDVLSKDDKSVTLKLRDGSTRLVFYSSSTSVGKAVAGSAGDLAAGQQITVAGTANSDGSVTAQQIQIRPEQAPMPGGPQGN